MQASALEASTSLDPRDYTYPQHPSPAQAQQLLQQSKLLLAGAGQGFAPGAGQAGGFQGAGRLGVPLGSSFDARLAAPGHSLPASHDASTSEYCNALALDLDDDCLRLLLGDESAGAAAPAPAAAPAAKDGCAPAGEERAMHTRRTAAAAAALKATSAAAAGRRLPFAAGTAGCASADEEEDVALLFGDSQGPRGPALDSGFGFGLDLVQDLDTATSRGAGGPKRARSGAPASEAPPPLSASLAPRRSAPAGLMLSMNYDSAVQSINDSLIGSAGDARGSFEGTGTSGAEISCRVALAGGLKGDDADAAPGSPSSNTSTGTGELQAAELARHSSIKRQRC